MTALEKKLADAHINREYAKNGDTPPTTAELEELVTRVEYCNEHHDASLHDYMDAQSELIDALLVKVEALQGGLTDAQMSRLTFLAREEIAMWADVVEIRSGKTANHTRVVMGQLDQYRKVRGWNPDGFGGEDA